MLSTRNNTFHSTPAVQIESALFFAVQCSIFITCQLFFLRFFDLIWPGFEIPFTELLPPKVCVHTALSRRSLERKCLSRFQHTINIRLPPPPLIEKEVCGNDEHGVLRMTIIMVTFRQIKDSISLWYFAKYKYFVYNIDRIQGCSTSIDPFHFYKQIWRPLPSFSCLNQHRWIIKASSGRLFVIDIIRFDGLPF